MTKEQFIEMGDFLKENNINITYDQACRLEMAMAKARGEAAPILLVEDGHIYYNRKNEGLLSKLLVAIAAEPHDENARSLGTALLTTAGYLLSEGDSESDFKQELERFCNYTFRLREHWAQIKAGDKKAIVKNPNVS